MRRFYEEPSLDEGIVTEAIEAVAWAVQPGSKSNSRAVRLVEALRSAGVIKDNARYFHHGRAGSSGQFEKVSSVVPKVPFSTQKMASLSPVFQLTEGAYPAWVDLYDDWSIAPDINVVHRRLAARTYRTVRRFNRAVITVNSPYMASRVASGNAVVIPNGVDERISYLAPSGDDRKRLIVLGNFFEGRTDWSVILKLTSAVKFDEIVVGRPGRTRSMARVLSTLKAAYGAKLRVLDWIDDAQISNLAGRHSIALIPHVVSDYTLSQDLMKVYQLSGLGIRIVCPRMLWPAHLSISDAFLYDFGADLRNVGDWMESAAIEESGRLAFIRANSWARRAESVLELLKGAK